MFTVFVIVPFTENVTDAVAGDTYAGDFRFDDDDDALFAGMRMLNCAVPVAFACEPEPEPPPDPGVPEVVPGSDDPPPPPQPATAIAMIAATMR
jgi:hypothetical protein